MLVCADIDDDALSCLGIKLAKLALPAHLCANIGQHQAQEGEENEQAQEEEAYEAYPKPWGCEPEEQVILFYVDG